MPHLETASLGVWVASGSRDERHDEHGISHFLEHMAFKGTRRRSARQIAEEIEAVGADLNAATGAETTAYYARVLKSDVPLALDVLADILSEPSFESEEVLREQNVIIQEIGAVADTPDDLIFEHLQIVAFPNQSLGRSILGPPQTRPSFDRGKGGKPLSPPPAPPPVRCPNRRVSAAAPMSRSANSSKCTLRSRCRVYRSSTRRFIACRCSPIFLAAACPRGCSRKRASGAVYAIRFTAFMCRIRISACLVCMPAPTRRILRN